MKSIDLHWFVAWCHLLFEIACRDRVVRWQFEWFKMWLRKYMKGRLYSLIGVV